MIQMTQVEDFYNAYRDRLEPQYQASINLLDQQRKNSFDSIMSQANKAGMLYSNFPMREKQKYDANTYLPAVVNARTSYQTGLDSLRNKGVSLANYITSIQEAINDLNKYSGNKNDNVSLDDIVTMTQGTISGS